MDSERSANRAVNYENGATLNGCKISESLSCFISKYSLSLSSLDVEFSSAALKAGARCKYLYNMHPTLFSCSLDFLINLKTSLLGWKVPILYA